MVEITSEEREFQSNLRFCPENNGAGVRQSQGSDDPAAFRSAPEADSHPSCPSKKRRPRDARVCLRFSSDHGSLRDIVRQQWNFNAPMRNMRPRTMLSTLRRHDSGTEHRA